ncbi:uncharacterized protein LOC109704964 isoform X3 [Ananas comosus]|uniref:Uncharacterized protein LOC109704964 isoform X3 n=1 Tax=Ananas comosus TaxID=4615 RepID=A0A6P5ED24_ANACO|nr:uncharacterized protein LOC109704964 isoform X3 [Ananas comosus]
MEEITPPPLSPLSPYIASLRSCFAAAPPAAVPAIVDCVAASASVSPNDLFVSLLRAFPDPAEVLESNYAVSHAAALCHLIKNTEYPRDAMRSLIWRVFVPLLKAIKINDTELLNPIVGLLCDAISKNESWELLGTTIVPFCLRSIGLGVGLPQNDELSVYKWSSEGAVDGNFEGVSSQSLPLITTCRILKSLLIAVLKIREGHCSLDLMSIEGCRSLDALAQNLTWDLSKLVLCMLTQSPDYRSCATRMLLPVLLGSLNEFSSVTVFAHEKEFTLSRFSVLKDIWKCCISLFSLGRQERSDAYSILSLYFSHHVEKCETVAKYDSSEDFDIRDTKEFWEEVRKGLVDRDGSVRKQALYVIKILLRNCSSSTESDFDQYCSGDSKLPQDAKRSSAATYCRTSSHATMTKRERWADEEAKSLGVGEVCHSDEFCSSSYDRWKVFLLLYETLEEYGTHLVEAAWTHQVALLLQSRSQSDYLDSVDHGGHHFQMETLEGVLSWMVVLWERGFSHENPQVRCLIMQSFLDIGWKQYDNFAQRIPKDFVLGPLINGLNDVVHHKDFGVRGVYSSKTIEGAAKFFHEFSRQMMLSVRLSLVWSLASAAKYDSFGRAGLMALAFCIASSAGWSEDTQGETDVSCALATSEAKETIYGGVTLLPVSPEDVLDALGVVIERSKQHFNPNYRLKVCQQVLKAASALINITDVPLDLLLHFLSSVPREFTDLTGSLRGIVQQWLVHSSYQCPVDTSSCFFNELISFPTSFISHTYSAEGLYTFDDEDVGAWEAEAQRWARVLLLIDSEQHIEPIFKLLQNYGSNLSAEDQNIKWRSIKFLIIILRMVEELQINWRKLMSNRLDQFCPLLISICENFTVSLLPIMEELVVFAKSVCPLLLSVDVTEETDLPCSVKGKLGGPSQRRLASFMTSSVLQAVLLMRTVACVLSWCSQHAKDVSLNSSFTFLSEFSWKVIQSPTYATETGAEVRLAAYEALAYVLSALSSGVTSFNLDFTKAYSKPQCLNGEREPSLDLLAISFLTNINDLLANGVLTRSRRAVLMYWKWLCMESLLAIPYSVSGKGIHRGCSNCLFADSTLRTIFSDIVESLENAGENSVLSILRCVRLVFGLSQNNLHSCRSREVISSLSKVDCQMMRQLVKSSWLLHLSCNKRRVAPIAALLSAVLHPAVFSDLNMHETDGKEKGPLKWFVEQLLDEGVKSPRTIRLAALHLTGLWLLHPKVLKCYIKELKLLSLYGSVAFDEDFDAERLENHDARAEVFLLAQSPDCEFTEVFINTEMYARVSVAVLFYQLGNLCNRKEALETEESLSALQCGKLFLLELLDSAVNDKDLSKELYKKYSSVHRRKVRAWQMICVLSHFVEEDIVEEVTSKLHLCLYRNNLPAVRQYLETFAIQIYLKFPTLAEQQLIPIFHNYTMRAQALSSYVFIAANIILHSSDLSVQIKHLNELLPPIVPFLTSHHHSLRGFTQVLVYCVLSKLWPALKLHNSEVEPLEKKCFEDLKTYLAENTDCARLRASMEGFYDIFDPKTSATPAGIFGARFEFSRCRDLTLNVFQFHLWTE